MHPTPRQHQNRNENPQFHHGIILHQSTLCCQVAQAFLPVFLCIGAHRCSSVAQSINPPVAPPSDRSATPGAPANTQPTPPPRTKPPASQRTLPDPTPSLQTKIPEVPAPDSTPPPIPPPRRSPPAPASAPKSATANLPPMLLAPSGSRSPASAGSPNTKSPRKSPATPAPARTPRIRRAAG